jgi:uncharacterized protein (AIM24 family)
MSIYYANIMSIYYYIQFMSDVIDYKVHGDDVQFVQTILDPGEAIVAEAGTMFLKDPEISIQTSVEWGIKKWIGRIFTGESFFIPTFTNTGSSRKQVFFSAPYMGKIISLDLAKLWWEFICQKSSFICAAKWTELEVAFTKKIWWGFFGGEWFILQRIKWDGMAFIHAGGSIIKMELQAGKKLQVDTGCIVWFSPSVEYSVEFVGGIKNSLFGGEWLFLTTLSGPGTVYLQSLPFSRLADSVLAAAGSVGRKWDSGTGGLWDIASIAWKLMR